MRLTEHFTLDELTDSDTALRLGIDNTPPDKATLDNLTLLASSLEQVRAALGGVPLLISSGYRCEALEIVIARSDYLGWLAKHGKTECDSSWREYFARKIHPKGLAADFRAPAFGDPMAICRQLAGLSRSLPFEQIIQEGRWVHFAVAPWPSEGKREVLTAHFIQGKAHYSKGLA